jgi:glycosyl transferase, family 25
MWPSYVINLRDNTGRLSRVSSILNGQNIPFSRIEAVNGWELTPAEIGKVYDESRNARDGFQPLIPAEIGCYLSHIDAWRRIAEGDAPGGFIFEDDFAATANLAPVLKALSTDTAGDWDMVKLFTLDSSVRLGAERTLLSETRIGIPYRVPTCLMAYGLTKHAAARLVARAIPFFRPVDEDQKFVWETGLRVALILPPPVFLGDQETSTGTIGAARRKAKASSMSRLVRKFAYSLRYRLSLARHRRQEGWRV